MFLERRVGMRSRKQTYGGHLYDSGFEASYAAELDLRVKAKDIKGYDRQTQLRLIVKGFTGIEYVVATYKIDFVVHHNNGDTELIECKGYADPLWRLKWKILEANYSERPGYFLTVVKQRDNFKLTKIKRA